MSLQEFLENKPLYYTEIDYTRMPRVYEKIKLHFNQKNIIHIVGTNGKGTTGRFLATALYNMGYKTAHYTSPHILEFNERIWMNGENVSYESLEISHEKLQGLLSSEDINSLSYFEYTTFLAMLAFKECEYIVLEAGLGGEHDATAVFDKVLTLVTPIAYDHESFLGNTIELIAREKLNAIQNNAIIARQKYEAVYDVVREVEEKNCNVYQLEKYLSIDATLEEVTRTLSLSEYLRDNLQLSMAALQFLGLSYKVKDFKDSQLFGRLTKFKDNIILDVGHNPLAAESIAKSLNGVKYTLIYNTYKDKEYKKILHILKPIIQNVEIIEINEQRIESKAQLQNTLKGLEIEYKTFTAINENEKYLVFGSFSVVEAFLKAYSG